MNREIKFRVWDEDLKRMRYLNTEHDFICFHSSGRGYYENRQTGPGEWFSGLMQYTGLKDKNGKEIYEGDILKAYEYYYPGCVELEYKVEYVEWLGQFVLEPALINGKYNNNNFELDMSYYDENNLEVIGNIYEREVTNAKD